MNQSAMRTDGMNVAVTQWCFDETEVLEQKKQALRKEKKELERERTKLEREKREFFIEKESEDKRLESEKKLFEMKWKILEGELKKLADEKKQVEKQRKFYQYVNDNERHAGQEKAGRLVRGDMFFVGVADKQALRKRYKDLIKIYHPDNVSGDVGTIQEINREYDRLQAQYQ